MIKEITIKVMCPNCGKKQLKLIRRNKKRELSPTNKIKKCVFCERRFCIHRNPQNSQIIK